MGSFFASMPDEAALAFVLGGVLFASGALLIALVVRHWFSERNRPVESLLAPVLAVDTLAPELRVVWVKSMLLEAETPAASQHIAMRFSREVRRCLVEAQACKVAGRLGGSESLRLAAADYLDQALASAREGEPADGLESLRRELQEKRTALGEVAEGR